VYLNQTCFHGYSAKTGVGDGVSVGVCVGRGVQVEVGVGGGVGVEVAWNGKEPQPVNIHIKRIKIERKRIRIYIRFELYPPVLKEKRRSFQMTASFDI